MAAAAAAIGTAAALTDWRIHDALLFGLLAGLGAAAVELTRRITEPAGLIKDVHGIWQLPMALLLPPVYCLTAPAITFTLLQLRTRRTLVHRQVFSAAANGLSLAGASLTFHALNEVPARPLLWLLAAVGCALAWSAVNKTLVASAVWLSDRTVSIRERLFTRGPLVNDACEITVALLIAGTIARVGLVLASSALPLAVVLQRSFRHAQLQSAARVDADTGLLHAATWRQEAAVVFGRTQRAGLPVAVGIADLDHFQAISSQDWRAGEAVIATVAGLFHAYLRADDLVGKLGGKEFVFLLPGVDGREALRVAERLRGAVAAQPITADPGGAVLHVTISIGVAATAGSADCDLIELLTAADAALDRAKQTGRDRVCLAPGSTDEPEPEAASAEEEADEPAYREELVAARRNLGSLLAAWRKRAGLTQQRLAERAGYSRGAVASAEKGEPASRDFWAAVDPVVGARGVLVAKRDEIETKMTAARRRAARLAWLASNEAARPGITGALSDSAAMTSADSTCPHCGGALGLHVTKR